MAHSLKLTAAVRNCHLNTSAVHDQAGGKQRGDDQVVQRVWVDAEHQGVSQDVDHGPRAEHQVQGAADSV